MNDETRLAIVGFGRWAATAADAAASAGTPATAFIDDHDDPEQSPKQTYLGLPVTTLDVMCEANAAEATRFFIAIGDNETRRRWMRRLADRGATAASLVHSFASVGHAARLDRGVLVAPTAIVDPEAALGEGVLIGARVVVCHETEIKAYCRIEPGAVIGGRCEIGEGCTIGSGAVVLSNVRIGRWVAVEPGTVVTKNIPDNVSAAGIPARVARQA